MTEIKSAQKASAIRLEASAQKEADMKENNHMNNTNNITNTANTINSDNTGNMDINVTVTPMQNQEGCIKANASVVFNGVFKVTGIRIGISQKGNIFVSMPDYKTGRLDDNGKDIYQDIAYPVTRQFRQELYEKIVKEFTACQMVDDCEK